MMFFELQELACAMLGWDYDDIVDSDREDDIEDALADKFGISYEQLGDLVKSLLPLTMPVQSPLTGEYSHVFGRLNGYDGIIAIIKIPVAKEGGKHED